MHTIFSAKPNTAPRNVPRQGTHVAVLDGVRGLAVLMVLFYHSRNVSGPLTSWDLFVTNYLWSGVDLFFVLSGFLITGILLDTRDRPGYLRNFVGRRAVRILPLYYGYLVVVLFVLPLVDVRFNAAERIGAGQFWYWIYLQNYAIGVHAVWPHSMLLNHLWSLAIEEQFYLFWPFVVWLLPRRWMTAGCLGLAAASIAVRVFATESGVLTPLGVYVMTPTRLDGLALGGAIAALIRTRYNLVARLAMPMLLAGVAGCLAVTLWQGSFYYTDPCTANAGFAALAVLFGGIIARSVTASHGLLATSLMIWPLRTLGKYSYGLYVWHQLCFTVMRNVYWNLPVAFAVAIVTAWLSWHLYEKRFLALKSHFEYASRPQ